MKVAVIGGGAAGFFSAIAIKDNYPDYQVEILEKSTKLLSKVAISGGGRCNVTNGTLSMKELVSAYPRGGKELKKAFKTFSNKDTMKWFADRGVVLKTEEDGRVFPTSNSSATIIDCFMNASSQLGIKIRSRTPVSSLKKVDEGIELLLDTSESEVFDKVVVASGGSPKLKGLEWLQLLGHKIEPPSPSLFSFNMPQEKIKQFSGLSVKKVKTTIAGTKFNTEGPILITHWGMSGPAILKLSSYAARELQQGDYRFTLSVCWCNELNQDVVRSYLQNIVETSPAKQLSNVKVFELPSRLWLHLIEKAQLKDDQSWSSIPKKGMNKLVEVLCNDGYQVEGKTTFKDEFVTCGGVSLDSIDFNSMQSKHLSGLYFCGEVLDIDAITGGFNFQAAWTTAYIAGKLL